MRQRDITFLVDISGSLEDGYDIQLSFMRQVVKGLDFKYDRTHISFVTFSSSARTRFFLDSYNSDRDILNAITIDEVGHQTNIAAGIREMRTNVFQSRRGDRDGVDNICILLSDGKATMDASQTEVEAGRARAAGIAMYAVSVGESVNMDMMGKIANKPESLYTFSLRTRSDVDRVAPNVLDNLCT